MTPPVVLIAGARAGSFTTSVSVNTAGLAARGGTATLLVALDRHADAAVDLGTSAGPEAAVQTVRPDLDLLTFGASPPAHDLVVRALRNARDQYGLVVIDGSAAEPAILALVGELADHRVVLTRSDRAATAQLREQIEGLPGLVGVVITGVSGRPRAHLVRTRRALEGAVPAGVPVFAAAVHAEAGIAWWARDRGVLMHELVAELDREVLDAETVVRALRLARDHRDVASELLARIGVEKPV